MAIRNMRLEGDDILRKKSRPVEKFDRRLWELLDDMADTLAQQNGAGLAGVQVGVLRRVFLVDAGEGPVEFINPEILATSGSQRVLEGCLSYPGQWGMITRPNQVRIRAQDRRGRWFELEGEGLMAQAMLHENGHLDGLAFKDDPTFTPLSEEEVEAMAEGEEG
ncbi:MAG: peptide deformylase [Angelakisella sp.]|jgi:peptide deformylase|nr:peptide deformylase [Angelakisella sp.]MCI9529567.1 peptide deformylase [Angelakisella sp.]